jgi:hypothetical protein
LELKFAATTRLWPKQKCNEEHGIQVAESLRRQKIHLLPRAFLVFGSGVPMCILVFAIFARFVLRVWHLCLVQVYLFSTRLEIGFVYLY